MKIHLAQINTVVGDIGQNENRILEYIEKGRRAGADLVVFPEFCLVGYPPRDLVLLKDLLDENLAALARIAESCTDIAALVGYVDRNSEKSGKPLLNAAALCTEGRIYSRHYKMLLPTYDIFDEGRYFDSAESTCTIEYKGFRIGVTICEDIWNFEPEDGSPRLYDHDPVQMLAEENPDFIINISASPFSLGKRDIRNKIMRDAVRRAGAPLVNVNLVGGNDSIIFDGCSGAWNKEGELIAQCYDFREDGVLCDLSERKGEVHETTEEGMPRLLEALKMGLSDYMRKCGFKRCVLGLSGGIDSSLVAAIAVEALGPGSVTCVSMPSRFTSEGSKSDAEILAENLGIKLLTIPIEGPFKSFLDILEPHFKDRPFDVTEENIQARVRGVILMALSNKFGWLVLSTGNKSELAVGYCTLYGDMTGGLAVISDVPKTLVYKLARYINRKREIIPNSVIEKAPSAELRPDQKDEDSLPPYEKLDPVIREFVEGQRSASEIAETLGFEKEFVEKILHMIYKNEYKRRQAAPGLKVTGRAFGEGWRMPIAASWWKKKS